MNEVAAGTYKDFKLEMDKEIRAAAAGFVKIGYLLKVARDTDVLRESGYQSVAEFAKAEYGLEKDVVSRYIAINDRYSENGYSEYLQEKYSSYGVAKLAEMITLPEEIAEQIQPDMTRKEIQELKHEYKEEQKITDLEVMMEDRVEMDLDNVLEEVLYEHFKSAIKYKRFFHIYHEALKASGGDIEGCFSSIGQMMDVLAPHGFANIRERISGKGRLMLTINGEDEDLVVTNMRSMEKETFQWAAAGEALKKLYQPADRWEDAHRMLYDEEPEENEEVAPVQPEKAQETAAGYVPEEKKCEDEEQQEEVQVPGQTSIEEDFPQYMPEPEVVDAEFEEVESKEDKEPAQATVNTTTPYDRAMITYARNSLENINKEMDAEEYLAALVSARRLVYYLERATGEKESEDR